MSEYSGGEVLPGLNRVHVSRADLNARQLRYDDDTDMDSYVARLERRERVEMIDALQRHRQQQRQEGEWGVRGAAVKSEEGEGRLKQEEADDDGHAAAAATRAVSARRGVKTEADDSIGTATERGGGSAAQEGAEGAGPEYIDVDALMEDTHDQSAGLLMELIHATATQQQQQQQPTTPRQQQRRPRRGAAVVKEEAKMDAEELAAAYAALDLPPEPAVTLVPGITIAASCYDKLLDYQQEGLRWLVHLHAQRTGGVLGDEMGLGKTIQVAALLNALHNSQQLRGPALIVTPMTVLRQWVAELHRWAPRLRVCVMHESAGVNKGTTAATSRGALMESVRGTPAVVVTTYAAMRMSCAALHAGGFQYVILDEGHKISNPEAGVTLAAKSFPTPHRLILSGSPIQNRLKELWCLFDFVRPGILGTMVRFIEEFEEPISRSRNIRATPMALASAVECARTLQTQIAPYFLRRLKRQVNTILPRKFERVIRVPLSDEQLELYVELLASPNVQRVISDAVYRPLMWGGGLNRDGRDSSGSLHVAGSRFNAMAGNKHALNRGARIEMFRIMNQLRQICNHADLFKVVRGEDDDYLDATEGGGGSPSRKRGRQQQQHSPTATYRSFRSNKRVNLDGSGKLRVLLEMCREWKTHGHRALIFTQTRMMLDILENLAEQENYRYIRLDGTTLGSHRQELMDRFNEDDTIFLALLTTRVGGIGVNLTGADRVVIFDPDWNPVTDVQARERAWRIGQTRDVCVYRLISTGSVEEAILRRQLSKTYVTDKVLKDPNLQRFFQQQGSLAESFFLSADYDERVPIGRKHILAARELSTVVPAPQQLADVAGGEQERALEHDDDDDVGGNINNNNNNNSGGNAGRPQTREGEADSPTSEVKEEPVEEREFGELLSVVAVGGADDDGSDGADGDDNNNNSSNNNNSGGGAAAECETGLLKNLFDGQKVAISGADAVAQRLARAGAVQRLQRVVNGGNNGAAARTFEDQRREFSLIAEAERRKAKDDADRAEQRAFNQESLRQQREEEQIRQRRRHGW